MTVIDFGGGLGVVGLSTFHDGVHSGAFPTHADEPVRCGVCCKPYDSPRAKVEHLRLAHHARVERHLDGLGNALYVWHRPREDSDR
jgi:hypothetical protein